MINISLKVFPNVKYLINTISFQYFFLSSEDGSLVAEILSRYKFTLYESSYITLKYKTHPAGTHTIAHL